ncbi:MAG: VPS10 domain-containing protein [Terriglobia bacterium]
MKTKRVSNWIAILAALLAILKAAGPVGAQQASGEDIQKENAGDNTFKGMQYRLIGPFRGGRVLAVTGVAADPNVYYFGAVSGGVWKTTDGGVNWTPLFDKETISSIGSIALAPSDPNVIYVGTGEACIRGNISYGDGVYKSVDGGKTWTNVGLKDTRQIGKVVVDPRNPDIVLVAALGHAYGPNEERGVFRSTDGGKTWQKVLYKDNKTGAIDVAFDPSNSHILFAALWEAHRTPYSLESGGPGSGLYKSGDGGSTWKRLQGHGLPGGILGRIGVSVSGADPNRVYAQIEATHDKGGLYVSSDGGDHWALVNGDHRFTQRAWYYMHVFADPKNVDTVYELNTGTYRSTDGGGTFEVITPPHGDCHGLWIDPTNPARMIEGNDGGATITVDGGKTWSTQYNQPTAQFYHVIADQRFPYYVYGAQQDNTTVAIASRTDHDVIDRPDWYPVGGGESGYIAPDPRDPNIVYAGGYEGEVSRFDKRTEQAREISAWPQVTDGLGAAGLKYRVQWTAPLVISPHDPNAIYLGAQVLLKSTDGGGSWSEISPDLTRNDKSKQQVSGGPITKDDTGTEYYDTIFTIAESPLAKDLIWVGSDDGLIHLTRDDGKSWEDVTPKDMPEWSMISLIDASPHEAGTAYAAVDRHRLDDIQPYAYKTTDYGKTWRKITNGLPDGSYVHVVREDPKRKDLLFAGTETGVLVSFDGGDRWQPLKLNLPATPVHDLVIHGDDLLVATHGRSFWILDDLAPLRQFNPEVAASNVHLYEPAPAYRLRGGGFFRAHGPVGANPPSGAMIDYYLKTAAASPETGKEPETSAGASDTKGEKRAEITLEIRDGQGRLVRKFSSRKKKKPHEEVPPEEAEEDRPVEHDQLPAQAGLNRFVWDLKYAPPREALERMAVFSDYKPTGPLAPPGKYHLKLTAGGQTQTATLEVKLDSRVSVSDADLQKQFDLAMEIRDSVNQAHDTVNQIHDLQAQLKALEQRLADEAKVKSVLAATRDLDQKITALEEDLVEPQITASEDSCNYPIRLRYKLVALGQVVESADAAPTAQSYALFKDLRAQLDAEIKRWDGLSAREIPALNDLMKKEGVPAVMVVPVQKEEGL